MNELIKLQEGPCLSNEALSNQKNIELEYQRRIDTGLISGELYDEADQVTDYLERVSKVSPNVDEFVDNLIKGQSWEKTPRLVVTMPVVGTGGQEEKVIIRTIKNLLKDPLVVSGDIGILFFVNRPVGSRPDNTARIIKEEMGQINGIIIDSDIPINLGCIDGPFKEEMTIDSNDVPIALIRDILSISVMKMWQNDLTNINPPLILQMDGDFEGFMEGSFSDVIQSFDNPDIKFLQCSSDWDGIIKTESIIPLKIGSILMRELPQILKRALNDRNLPEKSRQQILFGEAIQRGIQAPQAERLGNIARKGAYGLLRMREDELDLNIRSAGFLNPRTVFSAPDIIFNWSNRRVLRTWSRFKEPPISQWTGSGFKANDPVRSNGFKLDTQGLESDILLAVNKTLAKFPIPLALDGVYADCRLAISEVLRKSGVEFQGLELKQKNPDLYYVQVNV